MDYNYSELIGSFLEAGYRDTFFKSNVDRNGALILRHVIDFDVEYADKISLIEDQLGVKSTFFFLMRSKSYNLLEPNNVEIIKSISARGHQVSIHFDPTVYQDIEKGFALEKGIFEKVFDVEVEIISIHRPSEYFLNNPRSICGVSHTYQPIYMNDIKYFSDSQGVFRYGRPLDSIEFNRNESIQLLTHPVWWVTVASDPLAKLSEFIGSRDEKYRIHVSDNCKPYKEYYNLNVKNG